MKSGHSIGPIHSQVSALMPTRNNASAQAHCTLWKADSATNDNQPLQMLPHPSPPIPPLSRDTVVGMSEEAVCLACQVPGLSATIVQLRRRVSDACSLQVAWEQAC